MKKFSIFTITLIFLFFTLKSDKRITNQEETLDFTIADEDFQYDDREEDFIGGIIDAFDNINQEPVQIEICPGTGVSCYIVLWDDLTPIVYLGKKSPGKPNIEIK